MDYFTPHLLPGLQPLTKEPTQTRLASHHLALNALFEGGLPFGSLIEWGAPPGRGARELLATFISNATRTSAEHRPLWCLWVEGSKDLKFYPPGWRARGVNLNRLCVIASSAPVTQLKPIFSDSLFKLIVLDAPTSLSEGDLVFLAQKARAHQRLILLLRPYLLSNQRGNVWAKIRVNTWQDHHNIDLFHVRAIRGLHQASKTIIFNPIFHS